MKQDTNRNAPRVVRMPAGKQTAARDVDREIALHLELLEADLVASGLSEEAARAEAARRFGDLATVREECVEIEGSRQQGVRRREWLAETRQDLHFALRTLRRAPAFAATVVLTLAIGIGATVAMFSVVDAVLLRALPLPNASSVVTITPRLPQGPTNASPALYTQWREQSRTLSHVAAIARKTATLTHQATPSRVSGAAVSGDYFTLLGVAAATGRTISRDDDVAGAPDVVVLSDRTWRGTLGAASDIVGRSVELDGGSRTVIGVMPAALDRIGEQNDFWIPLRLAASQRNNYTPYLSVLGRVRSTSTVSAARREVDDIVRHLGPAALRDGVRPSIDVSPLLDALTSAFRKPLLMLLGATLAILLIACTNVSTLMLARGNQRGRELAVRAALGAGRARLVRQLTTEHVMLAAIAALVACPIAFVIRRALLTLVPADIPRIGDASLDARGIAVAALLALLATAVCSIAPALRLRAQRTGDALRGGGATTGRRSNQWRNAFVATETALALTLLTGAGLLLRSALSLSRVEPGFDVDRVMTARLALPVKQYPKLPEALQKFHAIIASVRAEQGVAAAALVSRVPLGGSIASIDLGIAGARDNGAGLVHAAMRVSSSRYFSSMGIPIVAGRDLSDDDRMDSPGAIVVNEALAKLLAPTPAALIGRRLRSDNGAFADSTGQPRTLEVVGVARDILDGGLRSSASPEFFVPMDQTSDEPWDYWINREMLLVVRSAGLPPAALVPAMRRAVNAVDARVPLYDVRTTGERVQDALAVERFALQLASVAGVLALLLASIGIHSVVSYVVSQRTREAGVRLALGATAQQVVALVVRQSMRPVLAGIVVGIAGSLVVARAGTALLFGVTTRDPVAFSSAGAVMLAVGALACWIPARRMSRVMPASVLRGE